MLTIKKETIVSQLYFDMSGNKAYCKGRRILIL
nr:MAG TPA: hypothetical protein [Caudoviricetes sp.]